MPLFFCPNDNGSMQTVHRSGVEFDMCPTCRGVWLDRGELEKLLAAGRQDGASDQSSRSYPAGGEFGRAPARTEDRRDWDDDDHDDDDHGSRRKKRRPSIFDIFD